MPDATTTSFSLSITTTHGDQLTLAARGGTPVFVIGANGTGKSALLQQFNNQHSAEALRIPGHRQVWFESGVADITARQKQQHVTNIRNQDRSREARWINYNANRRPLITLSNLVDAQTEAAWDIANAAYADDMGTVTELAQKEPPVTRLNRLLRLANLPVSISLATNGEINAIHVDGTRFSSAQMSDGERNAVLIATEVLTAKPGSLILIDEPELHLHRSIITPLLSSLFVERSDCAFVVSTHEVGFAADFPDAPVVLLSSCTFRGGEVSAWQAVNLPGGSLNEDVRRDVLGSRRRILFVEGSDTSLDKRLYSAVFPDVTVVPKNGWADVERATRGVRDVSDAHWLEAFGIVDRDDRSPEDIEELRTIGVYALDVCTIESVYYHPIVQSLAVRSLMETVGQDAEAKLKQAREAALEAALQSKAHLAEEATFRSVLRQYNLNAPGNKEMRQTKRVSFFIDVEAERLKQSSHLEQAIENGDLEYIMRRYPIHKTRALNSIATKLGFQSRRQYEQAILTLVMKDSEALSTVAGLLGELASALHSFPITHGK